jgi:predicted phosphohydrolase
MALYVLGDLHLSLTSDKPMDVFGSKWADHVRKLRESFSCLTAEDTTVLCGDLSWAMSLEEASEDLRFVDALPGRKIILKGNHDYWWSTAAKAYRFFEENGMENMQILNNNCYEYGEYAICGTRGWFFEEERGDEHDRKIMLREVGRLEASLKAAGERKKLVFLHYPPIYQGYECPEILSLLEQYQAERCYYGHIHGKGHSAAFQGERNGTVFRMVSADYLDFYPLKVE